MKKILLGISMMMLSAVGMNVMAQNNQNVCPEGKQCAKEVKACETQVCPQDCPKVCPQDCPKVCPKECPKVCPQDCPKVCPKECPKVCPKVCPKDCPKECGKDCKYCPGEAVCAERQCAPRVCNADSTVCRADRRGGHHGKAFGKGRRGGNIRGNLFDGIDLSAEQKGKLQELNRNMAQERQEISKAMREKNGEARAEAGKLRKEAHDKYEAALKQILTKEQYAKYELNRKEMRVRAGARGEMRRLKSDFRNARQTVNEKVTQTEAKVRK